MSEPEATIVVCTWNGAQRIGPTLEAIAAQDAAPASFELVLVDNNSTDGSAAAIERHPALAALRARGSDWRLVPEPRQGLAYARARGVAESRGTLVAFVDDDNVPAPDYVREALAAFAASPAIGALVAQLRPEYEVAPPPSILRREHLLALNYRLGEEPIDFGAGATAAPTVGAGLWVRRSAYEAAMRGAAIALQDRTESELRSGGDIELGLLIGRAGLRRVYWPKLRVRHRIPPSRFETRYFVRLIEGIVRSELTLAERYRLARGGIIARAAAALALLGAGLATPLLLARRDGLREAVFVLASRWARVKGPYST